MIVQIAPRVQVRRQWGMSVVTGPWVPAGGPPGPVPPRDLLYGFWTAVGGLVPRASGAGGVEFADGVLSAGPPAVLAWGPVTVLGRYRLSGSLAYDSLGLWTGVQTCEDTAVGSIWLQTCGGRFVLYSGEALLRAPLRWIGPNAPAPGVSLVNDWVLPPPFTHTEGLAFPTGTYTSGPYGAYRYPATNGNPAFDDPPRGMIVGA